MTLRLDRDRLPFLTDVALPGSPSLVQAFNTLESNLFMAVGEPYPIDSDDGCNHLNVSSNVILDNAAWKTDFGGHTKIFEKNCIFFPYNPGWAHGGCVATTGDATNVFAGNEVVGIASLYTCGNDTTTCHQQGTPASWMNYSCACPSGETPHSSAAGNASSCATIVENIYYYPIKPSAGPNTTTAVCPLVSRIEHGSSYRNLIPQTDVLIAMAERALGMTA